MHLDLPPAPRILIVRMSAIGDVICAMPAVTALKRHLPDAHITWLVEHVSADLLQAHPHVDQVAVMPRRHVRNAWRRPWRVPGAIAHVLGLMRRHRAAGFDLAIDFQGNLKSGIFTRLSRSRVRVGHDAVWRKERLNALFTNVKVHPIPAGEATYNRIEQDLGMVRALGIRAVFEHCPLVLPEAIVAAARDFTAGLPGAGPLVVFHPGTSAFGEYKRWRPERFRALAERLIAERDARIAVSFGPGEERLAAAVTAGLGPQVVRFPPPSGLLFPAAVFALADLVVGADSGPLQLAGLMGAPTLTLFGPKDPARHRPMGARAEVVWMQVECSPCKVRVCDHVTCMESMQVEHVAAGALRMLETTKAGNCP